MAVASLSKQVGNAEETTMQLLSTIAEKSNSLLDAVLPSEKRGIWWERIRQFSVNNPKLAAFIFANIALSGPPIFFFVVFTTTVFIVSLLAALITALITALLFTGFMLTIALFIVLPTIFFTTLAAAFIFIWGLGAYYTVRWLNEGKPATKARTAIGDSSNSISGGRLDQALNTSRNSLEKSATKLDDATGTLKSEEPRVNGLADTKFTSAPIQQTPAQPPVKTTVRSGL